MAGASCCLLCVENFDDTIGLIDIDSAEGQELQVQQIVEQYFWEEVNALSATTRIMCGQCWELVSTFHQFYLHVKRAHTELVHCELEHDSDSCSDGGVPPVCEDQAEQIKVDIERLYVPHAEVDVFVEDQHINGVDKEEVEFVDVNDSADDECADETSSSEDEDDFESETERLKKQEQKTREKSRKADAFIAENFKITCSMCGVAAETFAELQSHFQTEHQTRGYVICCGRKVKHRATLVDHLCLHQNPQYFKCPKCGKALSSSIALRNHIKAHRATKKPLFHCNNCPKTFARRAALNSHKETHMKDRPYPCAECGKKYPSKNAMTHHFKLIHQNVYAKICDACGKTVRGNRELKLHMQKHTGPKSPVTCDICDRILTSERGLKLHMLTVHQAQSQTCPICFRVSQSMRAHQHHMNYMHKLKPKHACTLCDKSFKRIAHLNDHIRSHTKEASFACMFCQKFYASLNSRYTHYKLKHPKEWEEWKKQPQTVEHSED